MTEHEKDIRERLAGFYAPDEVEQWMTRPQPQLGGKTARELIDAGRIGEVDRVLRGLEDGTYL